MRHFVSVTLHLTSCNKASTLYIPHRCLLPFWPPKITRISYHTVISTNFASRRKQEYLTGFLPNSSNCRILDAAAIQMRLNKKKLWPVFLWNFLSQYRLGRANTRYPEWMPAVKRLHCPKIHWLTTVGPMQTPDRIHSCTSIAFITYWCCAIQQIDKEHILILNKCIRTSR